MKIEKGMYVRTNEGYIAKIKEIEANERLHLHLKAIYTDNYKIDMVLEDEILKASHNIIDLIEVGDYVKGLQVYETGTFGHNGKSFCRLYGNVAPFYEEDIKTIITKEQFESMQYEVK